MSYYIEKPLRGRLRSDRYRTCKELLDIETKEVLLSTREIKEIKERNSDVFHTVKLHEVGRLDIIANIYYKTPLLWWVIAQANDIYDPIEGVPVGALLRVPALETLYGNNGILL